MVSVLTMWHAQRREGLHFGGLRVAEDDVFADFSCAQFSSMVCAPKVPPQEDFDHVPGRFETTESGALHWPDDCPRRARQWDRLPRRCRNVCNPSASGENWHHGCANSSLREST